MEIVRRSTARALMSRNSGWRVLLAIAMLSAGCGGKEEPSAEPSTPPVRGAGGTDKTRAGAGGTENGRATFSSAGGANILSPLRVLDASATSGLSLPAPDDSCDMAVLSMAIEQGVRPLGYCELVAACARLTDGGPTDADVPVAGSCSDPWTDAAVSISVSGGGGWRVVMDAAGRIIDNTGPTMMAGWLDSLADYRWPCKADSIILYRCVSE